MRETDGGPAFPHEGMHEVNPGMSLRDWFVGQAPPAPDEWWEVWVAQRGLAFPLLPDQIVQLHIDWPWHYADAMLAAREKAE